MSARTQLTALHDSIMFERADGQCECEGDCGLPHRFAYYTRCSNKHGRPAVRGADKMVSLSVQYVDHNPLNNDRKNLVAMCQDCTKRHRKAGQEKAARLAVKMQHDALFDVEAPDETTGISMF